MIVLELTNMIRKSLPPRDKYFFLLITLMLFFGALLELAGLGAVMPVIALLVNPELLRNSRFGEILYRIAGNGTNLLLPLCCGTILFFLVKNLILLLFCRIQTAYAFGMAGKTGTRLLRQYLFAPYEFHLTRNTAESFENVKQTQYAFATTLNSLLLLFSEMLVVGVFCVSIFLIAPLWAFGVIAVIGGISWGIGQIYKKRIADISAKMPEANVHLTRIMNEIYGNVKILHLSNRAEFVQKDLGKAEMRCSRISTLLFFYTQSPRYFIESGMVFVGMGTAAGMLFSGMEPGAAAVKLSFLGMAIVRLIPSFSRIEYYNATLRGLRGIFERICKDLNQVKPEEFRDDPADFQPTGKIEIEHLSFRYPGTDRKIVEELSFAIEPKTSVAVKGPTGCGKTTLLDLIAGLLTPESGRILADGVDIRRVMNAWRGSLGYVPQNIVLADATVYENVAYGLPREKIDRERVLECLETAKALDFVNALEHGAETRIGEQGIRLSGGQRQRIGIARALYPAPSVLLLDEATSALDSKTESELVEALEKLRGKVTLIISAHRQSTMEKCDRTIDFSQKNAILSTER